MFDAGNVDPYVILNCRTQEQRSSIASGFLVESSWICKFMLYEWHVFYSVSGDDVIDLCFWNLLMVDAGGGSEPEWNETFVFTISDASTELFLKIMDKDTFSADDFLGEATLAALHS